MGSFLRRNLKSKPVVSYRRRCLLSAGFGALRQQVSVMEGYRAALALRDEAFRAWRGRAQAKALHCSLVTIRGKLHRQVCAKKVEKQWSSPHSCA